MVLWTCPCNPLMSSKVRKKAGERVQICFSRATSTMSKYALRDLLLNFYVVYGWGWGWVLKPVTKLQ